MMILEIFAMFDTAKVEIQEGQGKEGELQEEQQASCCSSEETQVWT